MQIDRHRDPKDLLPRVQRLFDVAAGKLLGLEDSWRPEDGAPVFTVDGSFVGALGVIGSRTRLHGEHLDWVRDVLIKQATELSQTLGANRS
jgi:hypothetical protein